MSKVVEVRFNCGLHDLEPEQVRGLLEAHDDKLNIDVGLGYRGSAAVTFNADEDADRLGHEVAQTARSLGLTVSVVEVLSQEKYEQRAWSEAEVTPNG